MIDQTKINEVQFINTVEDTAAGWLANDFVIPKGVWAIVTDGVNAGKMKFGNGIDLYSALPWKVEAQITSEQRTLLDLLFTANGDGTFTLKEGVNIAHAPILADAQGKIRKEALPNFLFNTMKIVATCAERDALSADYHNSPILVVDATGDPTVAKGGAMYAWYDPDGEGSAPEAYQKIAEFGEMDTNWEAALSDHFKYKGVGANTLDDILDGETYKKTTPAQITKLDGIEALADVTDNENVVAAHGMVTRTTTGVVSYVGKVLDAAALKALVAAGKVDATVA